MIDGHTMSLAESPADKDSFSKPRRWDKTTRDQLSSEECNIFLHVGYYSSSD